MSGRPSSRQTMAMTLPGSLRALARWNLALVAAALHFAPAQAQAPSPQPPASTAASAPSQAEQLLFLHDHLANSRRPGSLRYAYIEDAEGSPRVTDRAVLTLSAATGSRCCDVHGDYRSGAAAVNLPDIPDARANPVLLYFLESEVRRLQRTTAGQAAHFRRRIRQALVDAASVTEGTLRWGGRTVPARTVRVAPFLDDPVRNRFLEQAATEYTFVLSDAVPGGVYQLSAILPANAAGGAPLARRTLTLDETN
jgi:hypothetical protein